MTEQGASHRGHGQDDLTDLVHELAQAAKAADATGSFPWAGIRAVQARGVLERTVGTRYGGAGLSLGGMTRLLARLGEGDPSVALISAMTLLAHYRQAHAPLWPEERYRQLLAQARQGLVLVNAARVEPDLGSPSRGGLPATLARRTASGWSISGTKRFVTGAGGLTHYLVWARTDESPARVGTFIVPSGSAGIRIIENWNSLGMRATCSHDVEFQDVEVPHADVLALSDLAAATQNNRAKAAENLVLTSIYLGVGRAAQKAFASFARERVPANLGVPLSQTERFIAAAGEIDLLVSGAEHLIFNAVDHGLEDPDQLLRVRVLAGRQLQQAVQIAVQHLGNPGLSGNWELERHFRNIQSARVHAPQEDTVLALLGRAALAAPDDRCISAPALRRHTSPAA